MRLAIAWATWVGPDGNCQNPMYEAYWGVKADIRTLNPVPTTEFALKQCTMYNGRHACCSQAMESEFLDALKRWQDDWTGVIKRLTIFRDSSPSYSLVVTTW